MTAVEIRAELQESLEHLDEQFLKAIYAMVKTYTAKEAVVGYHLSGMPITQSELEEQIKLGEQQIQEGKYVSTKELKKKVSTWRNTK